MQAILLALAERQPSLGDLIEDQVAALQSREAAAAASEPARRQRQTPLDPTPFRRQVQATLHSLDRMRSSEAYWHVGDVAGEVGRIAEQARPFIEAGDGRSALAILEAVTEEYVAEWFDLDDSDGELGAVFADLGALWTEAILSADLTRAEREKWADRFTDWQAEVEDYGVDDAFDTPQIAALQGWDDPQLCRMLEGKVSADLASEEEPLGDDDVITAARLRILEREGRTREYLNLAAAKGQRTAYATMLARLGRIPEAVDYGLTELSTADEALALARVLQESGPLEKALRVGEHGLSLQAPRATLAIWLRDLARATGRRGLALKAAELVVRERPDLADYQSVQALAGEGWPALRDELLAYLRRTAGSSPSATVDILLHEGLIEDAIAVADASPYLYELVERVADAAVPSHPDWVIRTCRKQAERIMDEGKSKYYSYAVRWLEKARAAFLASGGGAEWQTYLDGLIAKHARKYSLVPMLKPLRVRA